MEGHAVQLQAWCMVIFMLHSRSTTYRELLQSKVKVQGHDVNIYKQQMH